MSKQAVIKVGNSQYLVQPGQEVLLDRPELDKVLMVIDGEKIEVGQPEVSGAQVKLTNLGQVKGEKVRTAKYKAKSRYHKVHGFRPLLYRVKIEDISVKAA